MRWFKRILLSLVVFGILLVIAVVIGLRFLPETEFIKSAVQERLRDVSGDDIAIGSLKIAGSFPDMVQVKVDGVTATSSQGEKLLTIERLTLTPSLLKLLGGELAIRSIAIDGVQASLRRRKDGTLEFPFVVAPVRSQAGAVKKSDKGGEAGRDADRESASRRRSRLKWSVRGVKLANSRIDFIDYKAQSETETVLSLREISASLNQASSGSSFTVDLTGQLVGNGTNAGPIKLNGLIGLSEDLSRVRNATVKIAADSLRLDPFRPYMVSLGDLGERVILSGTSFEATFEAAKPPAFSFRTMLNGKQDGSGSLKVVGEGKVSQDSARLENITASAETEGLAIRCFDSLLPQKAPFDPKTGFLKASIKGLWNNSGDWQLKGTADLVDIAPKGMAAILAKQVSVRSRIALDPQNLTLEQVEINHGDRRLVAASGAVGQPFTDQPILDLSVEATAVPQWVKGLGVRLPEAFKIAGPIAVRARLRGAISKLSVEGTGDMRSAEVQWNGLIEKPAGESANLEAKTEIGSAQGGQEAGPLKSIYLRLDIPRPRLRFRREGHWHTGWGLRMDCGIVSKAKTMDIHDAIITLKKDTKPHDVLAINANMENLRSNNPGIKGTAAVLLDKETLIAVAGNVPPNLSLTGEAVGKLGFRGTLQELAWNLDLPLASLGIDVESVFRKPAGIAGELKASGKWSKESLGLDNARLSMPGVLAKAKGVLVSRTGSFGDISLEVKKTDLKDLARFLPGLAEGRFSGPIEADIDLKAVKDRIVPNASVRLISVDYHPEKSAWSLRKLHGAARTDGRSLNVSELAGSMEGAIEAPLTVRGTLDNITSLKEANGHLSLDIGKGQVKSERWLGALRKARVLIGALLNPEALEKKTNQLEFDALTGDFEIKAGIAHTNNLRLKGPDFGAGAVGNIRLADLNLEALAGMHTVISTSDRLGKIPEIRRAAKKYEGVLKAMGLDKELKKVGIDVNSSEASSQEPAKVVKTPVTVILKMRGTASSPNVTPVLEGEVEKNALSQLKSLMN